MVYPFGGSRSESVTLPVHSTSDSLTISSHPGMHWRSTSGSLRASQTRCRGASIWNSPFMSMLRPSVDRQETSPRTGERQACGSKEYGMQAEIGRTLGLVWVLPFAGLLLSIAVAPLLAPDFWHR